LRKHRALTGGAGHERFQVSKPPIFSIHADERAVVEIILLDILGYLAILPTMNTSHTFEKRKKLYEARARVIKAMAHPTRLFIVEELSKGERCVCDLTEMVGADVSTVSKHLSLLRNAGIVEDDKRGTQVFYSLKVPCVLNFFTCVESVLESARNELATIR
jgi:ArsR family transcriptional regulator